MKQLTVSVLKKTTTKQQQQQQKQTNKQTNKRLKERFLIGRNRTKRANFRGSPLFQATYDIKTEKQKNNSTHLASVGCWRQAEGKGHETVEMISQENTLYV